MPDIAAPLRFDHAKLARLRRQWCDEHDATATQFAGQVPISYAYLLRLETGRPPGNPTLPMLGNLARLLGVQPADLLTADAREPVAS